MRRPLAFFPLLAVATLTASCGAHPSTPSAAGDLCPLAASQTAPLIVEWTAAARGQLEALRDKHVVAVRVSGCDLEVLPRCEVPAKYGYTPITPKHDRVTVHDEAELFANIPIHALALSGKLKSSGELNVQMTVVGRFEADRGGLRENELSGECDGATHLVAGLSAGAFSFFAGDDTSEGAGLDVGGLGAGTSHSGKHEKLNEDGDDSACKQATAADAKPPFGCGALIRLELVPIGHPKAAEPTCSERTRWDGTQCARVDPGSPASCMPGTIFAQGRCVPEGPAGCPAGTHAEEGRGCVVGTSGPLVQGVCLPGTHREGMGCVPDSVPPGAMVRIPGAPFQMGSESADNASPVHLVRVDTFEIDLAEVTVAAFKACVDAGKCLPPPHDAGCNWGKDGRERHPINCIEWEQARAYCEWSGKRLPTEAEWEFAAIGQTGWTYPWGNDAPDKTRSCQPDHSQPFLHTCPVGSAPAGKSRFGVLDMVGNVDEWMADAFCSYGDTARCNPKERVMRDGPKAAAREAIYTNAADGDRGFRCARTPKG